MRWLALALVGTGCVAGRVPRVPGDQPPAARDAREEVAYQEVLARFTVHRAVYDNLDTRIFVYATWQSPSFVEARLQRWAAFRALPAAELGRAREEELARLQDVTELFMAVHANDYRSEDFEKKDSLWRLALLAGGQELAPLSVERLGRPNVELRSMYSYLEPFWVGYRVRFPPVARRPGQAITFRLASPLGQADLPFTGE